MRALAAILLVTACGGREPARPAEARARPAAPAPSSPAAPAPAPEPEPAPEVAAAPDFEAPFPAEPCAPTRVALAHRGAAELPPLLTHAAAIRREDGRHVRIVIAGHPIERDARGRFRALLAGEARFELDAVRTRRGPLEPGPLGQPGARRGGLTHVRILSAAARFTFGHRGIGRVELTELTPERICGRVDLDDGFGRVRGAFLAPIAGAFVE